MQLIVNIIFHVISYHLYNSRVKTYGLQINLACCMSNRTLLIWLFTVPSYTHATIAETRSYNRDFMVLKLNVYSLILYRKSLPILEYEKISILINILYSYEKHFQLLQNLFLNKKNLRKTYND